MDISLRLNNKDAQLIKSYADSKRISVSEAVRQAVIERIEDELDLKAYNEALDEYKKNPVTYSLEEIERELDLNDV